MYDTKITNNIIQRNIGYTHTCMNIYIYNIIVNNCVDYNDIGYNRYLIFGLSFLARIMQWGRGDLNQPNVAVITWLALNTGVGTRARVCGCGCVWAGRITSLVIS